MGFRTPTLRSAVICLILAISLTSCNWFKRVPEGPFIVVISSEGPGTIDAPATQVIAGGTTIGLKPAPATGASFGFWAGPSSSEVAGNHLLVDGNEELKGVFIRTRQPDLKRYKRPSPILTPGPPGSWDSGFVADPFVFAYGDKVWLFYEGTDHTGLGRIGVAVSEDGITFRKWRTTPVVDNAPAHLSYPQVFRVGDDFYMHVTPGEKAMYLYHTTADRFPAGWRLIRQTVTAGVPGTWDEDSVYDGTVFNMGGRWMMIYSGRDHTGRSRLGVAYKPGDDIAYGKWRKWGGDGAPSPLFNPGSGWGTGHVRMGGSVVTYGGLPFFFYQGASRADMHLYSADNDQQLGLGFVSFPGSQGTPAWHLGLSDPDSMPSPVLTPTPGSWDCLHIHHMSVCEWHGRYLAVYDGQSRTDGWAVGAADIPLSELPPLDVSYGS